MDQKLEDFVSLLRRPGPRSGSPARAAARTAPRRRPPALAPRRRLLPAWRWPSFSLPKLAFPKPALPEITLPEIVLPIPGSLRFWINLGSAGAALAVAGGVLWLALPSHRAVLPPEATVAMAPAAPEATVSPLPVPATRLQLPMPVFAPPPAPAARATARPETIPAPPPAAATLPGATASFPAAPMPGREVAALPPSHPALRARSGEPPWLRYAVAVPPADGRPRIAIILDDFGLDRKDAERAIDLPGPLTLSFMAYASDLPQLTAEAHRHGHELMLHVPMQPISASEDMGPHGLKVTLGRDEILRRLRWDLDRFNGYVGINNHMGSRFTSDATAMLPVIQELKSRGLLFVDSRTIGTSVGLSLARKYDVPSIGRDVFLDNEIADGPIAHQLAEVEEIARHRGAAVAIGHPHPATIDELTAWLPTLRAKGFELVPVSALVKEHYDKLAQGGPG